MIFFCGYVPEVVVPSYAVGFISWWCHQMETFSALLAICAGNSPVTGEFPAHKPVTRSFDVFFDLCPDEQLSKESWGWWSEMPSCPLWRHSNVWIYSGTAGYCFLVILLWSLMMCANNQVHYGLMVIFVCLHITLPHYHHYADISEGIEFLKCLWDTFCQMCLRLSQFSQLSFMQYMGLCVFSLLIHLIMIVRIRVLHLIIIIKLEV